MSIEQEYPYSIFLSIIAFQPLFYCEIVTEIKSLSIFIYFHKLKNQGDYINNQGEYINKHRYTNNIFMM